MAPRRFAPVVPDVEGLDEGIAAAVGLAPLLAVVDLDLAGEHMAIGQHRMAVAPGFLAGLERDDQRRNPWRPFTGIVQWLAKIGGGGVQEIFDILIVVGVAGPDGGCEEEHCQGAEAKSSSQHLV